MVGGMEIFYAKSKLTRRMFLERLGAIGGAAAVYHGLTTLGLLRVPEARAEITGFAPDIGKGKSVIVIGAGVAGLTAAYCLTRHGYSVKVVEANDRYGGRSFTVRQGDKFAEVGGPEQVCTFTDKNLYLNAGPGRLPQHHYAVMDYCRELKVELEPYIFICESNRLQNDAVFDGAPVPFRRIRNNLRGEISELLAKVTQQGKLDQELTGVDKQRFLEMLAGFGDLKRAPDGSYDFPRTPRAGYKVEPGAGLNGGVLNGGVSLETILKAEYWKTGLFGSLQYYWQASLLQPRGGMDMIWHAFLKQPVPSGGTIKELVTLNSPVRSVRNLEVGGAKKVEVIHGAPGAQAVTDVADFCISTMAPIQLVQAGENFSTGFVNALAAIAYRPATKVGLQMSNRFWETEDRIYGGISWIRDDVSQVWYPSSDFHSKNGVLTAAYNNGEPAARFGAMPIEARIEAALSAGEKLHPGEYRENYTPSTALALAWQNMPHFIGGWANDQAEDQPDLYKAMVDAVPDGQVYLAGDFFSYWPGWQEGSVTSAELATKQILERTSAG